MLVFFGMIAKPKQILLVLLLTGLIQIVDNEGSN